MADIEITSTGVSETDIYLNTVLQGQINPLNQIDVNLEDSLGNPVTPISSNLTGNNLTIETYPATSGVALQVPTPSQFLSYRTGDVGWRWQNGWFSGFIQPTNPAKIAELDFTQPGQNGWFVLKNALTVNGVSSTVRFVDVDGVQNFPAINNKNIVVIDKLTGMMITRTNQGTSTQWNNCIDDAYNGTITVNGITYNDWFLISINEIQQIFVDSASGVTIATVSIGYTSDTRSDDTTRALQIITGGTGFHWSSQAKTGGGGWYRIWVRNAQNLIS
jgi:hypothetical protein